MFGLDPLSQPVAIAEIVLLLTLAALVGWLLGRLVRGGRVRALRASIAEKEAELVSCQEAKSAGRPLTAPLVEDSPPAGEAPPAFVPADPLLPAFSNDSTTEFIDVNPATSGKAPVTPDSAAGVPAGGADVLPAAGSATPNLSEAAVLSRIAARASEVNFDRIGRATPEEADDLKDIVGVGPFLERKLHSLGIYTFRQIVNFTREDVTKVNELIEFFPGRIERDNWVEQARACNERRQKK